jgi:hypothetical protein
MWLFAIPYRSGHLSTLHLFCGHLGAVSAILYGLPGATTALFPLIRNRTYLRFSILSEKIVEGLGHEVL